MRDRIAVALVALHISAVIYVLLGFLFLGLSFVPDFREDLPVGFGVAGLVFCLGLAVGIEVVAVGLRRRRFWAWVAALVIFGLYIPSLFLPLGALGMWGLLDRRSREAFGIGTDQLGSLRRDEDGPGVAG